MQMGVLGMERSPSLGAVFWDGDKDRWRTDPELKESSTTVRFVLAAAEVGGWLSQESFELLDAAAQCRSQHDPLVLHRHATCAGLARWIGMIAVSAQDALAATLIQEGLGILDAVAETVPDAAEVWADGD